MDAETREMLSAHAKGLEAKISDIEVSCRKLVEVLRDFDETDKRLLRIAEDQFAISFLALDRAILPLVAAYVERS